MGAYADQLALVRTAIAQILKGGQSVMYAGRSMTMADLKTLRELEKEYEPLAQAEGGKRKSRNRITYATPTT